MQNLILLHERGGLAVYVNPAHIVTLHQTKDHLGCPYTFIRLRGLESYSCFEAIEPADRIELCIREKRRLPMETAEHERDLAREERRRFFFHKR